MITLQERVHGVKPPKDWPMNKLHHVFRVRKNNKNIGMVNDNLLSLSYGRIVNKNIETTEGLLPESFETYQIVYPGDIVLRLTDLQNDKRSIRQGLVKEKGIITSAYDAVYSANSHDPRYWAYALLAMDLAKYYYSMGGGVRQSIKFKDFPNDWLQAPPQEKQKEIADFLDRETARIDRLIEGKKKLLNLLLEKEKSILSEMFLAVNAKKWRVRHLGKVKNGAGFPVELQGDSSQDVAFFKVKHLKTYGLDSLILDSEDTISKETADILRATIFPRGTIVLAKIGAALLLGRFAMLGRSACIDNNMAAFIPNTHIIDPNYALLGLSQMDMMAIVQPGTVPSLNTESFYCHAIPLPTKEEQAKFVESFRLFSNSLRQAHKKISVSLERLHEFRSSLITQAVTGQLDIQAWVKRGAGRHRLGKAEEEMEQKKGKKASA